MRLARGARDEAGATRAGDGGRLAIRRRTSSGQACGLSHGSVAPGDLVEESRREEGGGRSEHRDTALYLYCTVRCTRVACRTELRLRSRSRAVQRGPARGRVSSAARPVHRLRVCPARPINRPRERPEAQAQRRSGGVG